MAERRMFAKTIIDSDAFLEMSTSAQALYFHLGMRADDDGFVNNPKKIQRFVGAADDDLKILLAKRFVIGFESGVIVIKHWKMHNYIQKDRYKPTVYQEEKALLDIKDNLGYTEKLPYTQCIQDVSKVEAQVRDRLGKDRLEIGKDSTKVDKPRFAPPVLDEVKAYCAERKNTVDAEHWYSYYEANGWMVGRNKMKDWKASVRTWEKNGFSAGNKNTDIQMRERKIEIISD